MEKKLTNYEKLLKSHPEFVQAFGNLSKVLYSSNHLDAKTKELAAVALATSKRCKPCMRAHIPKAYKEGATKEQILEAAMTAVGFGGGPIYMTIINDVMDILEELK
ncbi:carboxymuconolactone decarboxylase family protein [[Mycoplasma] gypis]|uniref:Carboxymuconolactone decarboxylase family protein n=1 Tax=[Mycoplasma] gypis TaxID=92404 RepID=A0ABZ2RNZ8_9BACT|nr:carboxymuconolactone decarboxylase family protein [[Mycoplasma] gypis]MBN0919626.1 carboxymuconolactone decarboxylase family protein [[Mycoplasma] gypis]